MIVGEGGVGKTRLAFDFTAQLKDEGWQAGEAQGLEGSWYTGSQGTLLVIDYPEQRPEKVTALLEALTVTTPLKRQLRVLLLGRNGDFLNKLSQAAQTLVVPRINLPGLAVDDSASWDLFQQAWRRVHELKRVPVPPLPMTPEAFQQWRQQADPRSRPLFILALSIRLMLDPKAKDLSGKEIIRILTQQYEVIRLKKEAKKCHIDEYSLVMLRALAALSGRLDSEALRKLVQASEEFKLDIQLPTVRQLQETSLWSEQAIHALQPDLLAADLLHYALTELAGDQSGLWQYLGLESAVDIAEASSILGRLIHDVQRVLGQQWPLSSLTDWVRQEPERCERLNRGLNRIDLERTLVPLAIATNEVLLAQADSLQTQALYLNNLSIRLGESGDRVAGLKAIRRAVEIQEQLGTDRFAAYGPDLARSLNNLSNRLAESGDRAAALQAIRRAVEIREQLVRENFAAYGADLARSLNNLSLRLAESGDWAAGLQAIRRAVEIYEQLAADNFAVYGADLARSLNNLSLRLAESGDRAAGLQAIRRAVEIYEQLATDNAAVYGADLARSLNNLSLRLAESGDRAAGLEAIRRAVEIREQLARDNFAAYGPDLAMSLSNLSNCLAEGGDRAAGLQAIRWAVEIREQFATDNFAAYGAGLAMSLSNLSVRLAESGDRAASLEAIRRAVEIYEQLAMDNVAAYEPDLAMSLGNLSIRLAENGDRAAGLQAIRRVVEIYEQLATDNFAAYGADLASSQHNLSIVLARLFKNEEAAVTASKLQTITQRILDEQVQVPARLAWLLE